MDVSSISKIARAMVPIGSIVVDLLLLCSSRRPDNARALLGVSEAASWYKRGE